MSDLISRSSVIDVLKETGIIQDNNLGHLVLDEIKRIPVAYDVDAVEQELEAFKTTTWSDFMEEEVEIINLERAKIIVRGGGKE